MQFLVPEWGRLQPTLDSVSWQQSSIRVKKKLGWLFGLMFQFNNLSRGLNAFITLKITEEKIIVMTRSKILSIRLLTIYHMARRIIPPLHSQKVTFQRRRRFLLVNVALPQHQHGRKPEQAKV